MGVDPWDIIPTKRTHYKELIEEFMWRKWSDAELVSSFSFLINNMGLMTTCFDSPFKSWFHESYRLWFIGLAYNHLTLISAQFQVNSLFINTGSLFRINIRNSSMTVNPAHKFYHIREVLSERNNWFRASATRKRKRERKKGNKVVRHHNNKRKDRLLQKDRRKSRGRINMNESEAETNTQSN